jgi:hypothetical protein
MRRLLTGLLLVATLAGAATAAQPARVLAVEWEAGGGKLRWVSPTTLRPVGPAVLNVGGAPANLVATSPDGAVAAIGGGDKGRLRFVRLAGLQQQGRVMWLGGGSVLDGVWASPRRLVVLLGGTRLQAITVDPATRRVLRRDELEGTAMGSVRAGPRIVTLLAPLDRIGPTQLAIVGADRPVRTVAIPGIAAGVAPAASADDVTRYASPGLAADGTQAVVLGRESLVAVDLETLAVREQRLQTRTIARALKMIEGWGRRAIWLQGGTIAFTGWIADAQKRAAFGVWLADVDTGATRVLDASAGGLTRAGSTLLVHGSGPLRGFGLDGSLRFELLTGSDTGYVQVAGGYAYVGSGNSTQFSVVDVEEGRIVGRVRRAKPTTVLAP